MGGENLHHCDRPEWEQPEVAVSEILWTPEKGILPSQKVGGDMGGHGVPSGHASE